MRAIILCLALACSSFAQSLDALRQNFDQRCEQAATARDEPLEKLTASYRSALERLLEKTKSTGKLDSALPIHQELEALKQVPVTLPPLADSASELKLLRTKFLDSRQQILKTHASSLAGLTEKMEAALKERESQLTKAGKIADAVAAREAREELALDPDVRSARDLLKLGGTGGKGRAALQLRRYGDNLEVLVFYDRLGKISMDSPVENVRENTDPGKELGDTKAKVLGEFVGADGYTVDPYVAYNQTFDAKEPGYFVLSEIIPEYRHEVDKQKGVRLSFRPGAANPHGNFGQILPSNTSKGRYRIVVRYYIPKGNRALTGFQFVHDIGGPVGGKPFEETGKWVDSEALGESAGEKGGLLLYLNLAAGKKVADAVDDSIVLRAVRVEISSFAASVQKRFGPGGEIVEPHVDPLKQPLLIVNGEVVAK